MGASSETQRSRRVFRYSAFSYVMLGLYALAYIWLMLKFYQQEGWTWLVVVCVLLLPGSILEWSLQPTSFVVEGETISALWYWGRRRSWLRRELAIPGATARWTFGLRGYVIVFKRNGGRAFNLGIQLEDFYDFVELIEPGSSAKREPKHNPDSWWNRELFK